MKYSIVYALTRPDAGEKISVGLVAMGDTEVKYIYSEKKLRIAASLMIGTCSDILIKLIESFEEMKIKGHSVGEILRILSYLSRYSNNVYTVSAPRTIDVEWSEKEADALAMEYVGFCNDNHQGPTVCL